MIALISGISCALAQSYGHYKFYNNYGDTYFDYGANTYHAVNGASPGPDVNDAVNTDRGVYLGGNHFTTLHSTTWSNPPTLSLPFEILCFFMLLSDGPLMYGTDSDSFQKLKLNLRSDGRIILTITLKNSSNSIGIHGTSGITGSFNVGEWNMLKVVIKSHTPSGFLQYQVGINRVTITSSTKNDWYYEEEPFSATLLGTTRTSYMQGFIYEFLIQREGYTQDSTIFTNTCSISTNSCSICPISNSNFCLINNPDPYVNRVSASCSPTCSGGCDTSMNCLDCSAMPTCETEPLPIPQLCHPNCQSCYKPGLDGCSTCSTPGLYVQSPPGECICINGASDPPSCILCASDCASCSASTLCDSCVDPFAVPKTDNSGECACFSNASMENGYCVCNPGYYKSGPNTCEMCPSDCETCDSSNCLTCSVANSSPSGSHTCSCPSNSTVNGSSCECDLGYFDSDPSSSLLCSQCHSHCLSCKELTSCLTCKDSTASPSATEGCDCPEGSYMNSSEECEQCGEGCASCNAEECTSCLDKLATVDERGDCVCPSNLVLEEGECRCISGQEISSHSDSVVCIESEDITDEIIKFTKSPGTVALVSVLVLVGACSIISRDPMTLWTLFNTVQFFSYLPLHNTAFGYKLRYATESFEITNFIPNLIVLIYGASNTEFKNERENWRKYVKSVSFCENSGEILTTLLLMLGLFIVYLLLYMCIPCWRSQVADKLKNYKVNVFLRLSIELYLVMVYSGIVSLDYQLNNSNLEVEPCIGIAVLGICALFPLLFALLLYKLRQKIYEQNEGIKRALGSLFDEFELSEEYSSLVYYPIFFLRRFVYMISLFYFYQYPTLQHMVNISSCFLTIIIICSLTKFKSRPRHIIEIFTETGLLVFFIVFSFLNEDLDSFWQDLLEITLLTIAITIISANAVFVIINIIYKLQLKSRDEKRNKSQVFHIKNDYEVDKFEPVFVLNRNRQNLGIIVENNDKTIQQQSMDLYGY